MDATTGRARLASQMDLSMLVHLKTMANGNGIEFGADGAVLRSVNSGTQLRTFFQFPTARPNYLSNLLSVSH